ncbi:MAG TPA: hypothetical protein VGI22_03415 [Xanthobacteraceae bacterium]
MTRDLGQKHVRAILDSVAAGHARKHWLKTLRGLFAYAIEIGLRDDDPSTGIKVKVAASDGYHTWSDEEIAQYRGHWSLGSEPRLVLEFALETASRRCEVVRLGRQHVRAGRIKIARAKGCNAVDIPLAPELAAALAAMPATDHLTYLISRKGEPYSPEALGCKFADWATAGRPAAPLPPPRPAQSPQRPARGPGRLAAHHNGRHRPQEPSRGSALRRQV